MNDEKFIQRVGEVLREELTEPEQWQYVSFADEVFRGAVVIKAHGITDAVLQCNTLGINPGGQVVCIPMPDELVEQVPVDDRTRLLSEADVKRIWPDAMTIREHEEAEGRDGKKE